jgi:hypothetical protein
MRQSDAQNRKGFARQGKSLLQKESVGIKVFCLFSRRILLSRLPVCGKSSRGWRTTFGERNSGEGKAWDMKKILRIGVMTCLMGLMGIWPAAIFALSPEQVIALRQAGVSEETIRLMILQEDKARNNPDDAIGRREVTDSQGNTVITYSAGRSAAAGKNEEEKRKVENAWRMLQNMTIEGPVNLNPRIK